MPLSGVVFEKDENTLSNRIIDLFEKTRMAYLSARQSPKDYKNKWEKAVNVLRSAYDDIDEFSNKLKETLDEKVLISNEALDPSSSTAQQVYEGLKSLRYNADIVKDPFLKAFGDKVLEQLLENEGVFAQFIHWATRSDNKSLSEKEWAISDSKPDDITEGYEGLDIDLEGIVPYIIEHYGDGKDSKRVKSKFKGALKLLEKTFKRLMLIF